MSLLEGLDQQIAEAADELFFDAVLTRRTFEDSHDPGEPEEETFTCRALVETYSTNLRAEGTVRSNERKVLILGASLATDPKENDQLAVSGVIFTLTSDITIDAARALWECRSRM